MERGTGSKYRSDATLAEIKRGIVSDLRSSGLPGSFKVSVKQGQGSMCRPRVVIRVDGLPFQVLDPGYVEHIKETADRRFHNGSRMTEAATELQRAVERIAGAYGYDNSDAMTDHFDYAFNLSVSLDGRTREYDAALLEHAHA